MNETLLNYIIKKLNFDIKNVACSSNYSTYLLNYKTLKNKYMKYVLNHMAQHISKSTCMYSTTWLNILRKVHVCTQPHGSTYYEKYMYVLNHMAQHITKNTAAAAMYQPMFHNWRRTR